MPWGLFLALLMGCGRAASPPEEEHPAQVKAAGLKKATLEQWTAPLLGTSLPLINHSAQISAAVDGKVLKVLPDINGQRIREGQEVKKGQVIVQLDDTVLQAKRDSLVEQMNQADIAVKAAQFEVNRIEKLRQPGMDPLASPVELQKARNSLQDAQAKLKTAERELDVVSRQLTFYHLCSPIDGRLGMVNAVPGAWLTAGTVVADVLSLESIDILCYAPGDVAPQLLLDQEARLVRNNSQASVEGKVTLIDQKGQAATGMFGVKVRFPNTTLRLGVNAPVTVQIRTQAKKNALALPAAALSTDEEPPGVILVAQSKDKKDKEGKPLLEARKLQAILGIRDRDQDLVELLGLRDPESHKEVELKDDMQFVVEGGTGLESGDIIELQKEEHEEKGHDDKKEPQAK